jgi:hypothetical protein
MQFKVYGFMRDGLLVLQLLPNVISCIYFHLMDQFKPNQKSFAFPFGFNK